MARDITSGFQTEITSDTLRPVSFVEAFFDSETIRFWNGIGEITFEGNIYTGSGNLLNISEITETKDNEARGVSFVLSGISSSLIAIALAEPYQGRNIRTRFAVLDANNNVIADPFTFFSGKMDVMNIEESGETATIQLTAENELISLKRPNERRRTPEDQKSSFTGDTFFDNVASLQSADIVWGG